jgi:hypothetical protein
MTKIELISAYDRINQEIDRADACEDRQEAEGIMNTVMGALDYIAANAPYSLRVETQKDMGMWKPVWID